MPLPQGYVLDQPESGVKLPPGYALDPPGDVRSHIAARKANPPAAAMGDPNAQPQSTLETYAPMIAHPIEAAKGFGGMVAGGVKALAHPVDAFNSDLATRGAALDRIKARGIGSDDPENLRDLVSYALPGIGPAFAGAGTQMNSTDPRQRAQGFGGALALTSGPELIKKFGGDVAKLAPNMEDAIAQYQKVLDPKNENPTVARELSIRLLKERQVLSDPKAQLTAIQEQRAQAADVGVNKAIEAMPTDAVKLADVNKNIDAGATETGRVVGPNTRATLRKIGEYQRQDVPMNAVGDVASKTDVIRPPQARAVRQAFDEVPYAKESTTATANAQKVIGDALRQELNKDPNVKAANEQFRAEKAGKGLAESIPTTKSAPSLAATAARLAAKAGAVGVGYAINPTIGHIASALLSGGEVYRYARSVMESPGFKTWSAIQKAKFSAAVHGGDLPTVAQMGTQAGVSLVNKNTSLQDVLGGGEPPSGPSAAEGQPVGPSGQPLSYAELHSLAKRTALENGWDVSSIGGGRAQNTRAVKLGKILSGQ